MTPVSYSKLPPVDPVGYLAPYRGKVRQSETEDGTNLTKTWRREKVRSLTPHSLKIEKG